MNFLGSVANGVISNDIVFSTTMFKKPTVKTILIDGSNVIRQMYNCKKGINFTREEKLSATLYRYIEQYLVTTYDRILLFFDGEKRKINVDFSDQIDVDFSKRKSADDMIFNTVFDLAEGQQIVKKNISIITSDNGLSIRCKKLSDSVMVIKSHDFLREIGLFNEKNELYQGFVLNQ